MSDDETRSGQVQATPEGGPLDAGTPAQEAGGGQVRLTPEAGPLSEEQGVQPPSWREQMRGPIPGLDDTAPAASAPAAERAGTATGQEATRGDTARKMPPFRGKPVSEVPWGEALKVARPVLSLTEKLLITTIDLTGQGLSNLARYLEKQRQKRGS